MRLRSPFVLPILLLVSLLSATPAQAQRRNLEDAAWGAAALVGALVLDRALDRTVPDGGGTRLEWASDALNHGGRPQYALLALGGAWAGGKLARAPGLSRGAVHVGTALLASGVANGLLKYGVGRERPNETDDPGRFQPFSADNRWQSFPSGHAVVAFSLAASISEEARHPAVTALAYGGAALVGWSRVYDDKHWTSDVVGGALVGILTSRATLRLLHRRGPHGAEDGVRVAPLPGGVAVSIPAP